MSVDTAVECMAAVVLLMQHVPVNQRTHATRALLDEVERIHRACDRQPPSWIDELRTEASR